MGLPPFSLEDANGVPFAFPSGRPALLCFVKEDCPTCHLSIPLIQSAHEAFGRRLDVVAIGQDAAGNAELVQKYGLTAPMLDDSALKISFGYELDTVPSIILAGGDGAEKPQPTVGYATYCRLTMSIDTS